MKIKQFLIQEKLFEFVEKCLTNYLKFCCRLFLLINDPISDVRRFEMYHLYHLNMRHITAYRYDFD